jgi:hypothetical protein
MYVSQVWSGIALEGKHVPVRGVVMDPTMVAEFAASIVEKHLR